MTSSKNRESTFFLSFHYVQQKQNPKQVQQVAEEMIRTGTACNMFLCPPAMRRPSRNFISANNHHMGAIGDRIIGDWQIGIEPMGGKQMGNGPMGNRQIGNRLMRQIGDRPMGR